MLTALSLSAQSKTVLTLAVSSGDFDQVNSPVSVGLEGSSLQTTSTHYQLIEVGQSDQTPIPFQIAGNQLFWILSGNTPAGSIRLYQLQQLNSAPVESPNQLIAKRENGAILFQQFGKNILHYQFEEAHEPVNTSEITNLKGALAEAINKIGLHYPGLSFQKAQNGWEILMPDEYKVGHVAHFAQVTEKYLQYLIDGA